MTVKTVGLLAMHAAMDELKRAARAFARHPTNQDLWSRLVDASLKFADAMKQYNGGK